MLHVDLDLVEQSLDSFILKSVAVSDEGETERRQTFRVLPVSCSSHRDLTTL